MRPDIRHLLGFHIMLLVLSARCHSQAAPVDFYQYWLVHDTANVGSDFSNIVSRPVDYQMGYSLGQWPSRYAMPAWFQAYDCDRQSTNIDHLAKMTDSLLSFYRMRDTASNVIAYGVSPNGYVDGYRGWGNIRRVSFFALPKEDSIVQSMDYRYIVRIDTTTSNEIRNRVWLQPGSDSIDTDAISPVYDVTYSPWTNDILEAGSIALLSGWSKTTFRELRISRLNPGGTKTLLYDAYTRKENFHSDWGYVGDTAFTCGWDQWEIDSSGTIACDAANTLPGSYSGKVHKFVGRYAALVLQPRNILYSADSLRLLLSDLRSVQLDCVIRIDQRNIANAESGIAFRWKNPGDTSADAQMAGELRKTPFRTGGEEYYSYNPADTTMVSYFVPNAVYLAFKLRPHNSLEAVAHVRYNGYVKWWIAPYDVDAYCALNATNYNDGGYYDEEITSDLLNCANIGYYKQYAAGSAWQINSANAVSIIEDNFIDKWNHALSRDRETWVYGGGGGPLGSLTVGGISKSLIWVQDLAKIGLAGLSLEHNGSSSQQHQNFYSDLSSTALRLICEEYIQRQNGLYLFWENTGYIAEMNPRTGQNDLGHLGSIPRLLHQAWQDSSLTGMKKSVLDTLAKSFIAFVWNKNVGTDCRLNSNMDGSGYILTDTTLMAISDWPLLAAGDFEIWEIFHDFLTKYEEYIDQMFGRTCADMLYTVRYGKPKNLKLISLRGCGENGYVLRWDPPSDYPIGRNERPGTRLQTYNVYRRASSNGGSTWNDWHRIANIPIHSKFTSQPFTYGIQEDYDYPFWQDPNANVDSMYAYVVRSQDWSAGITNESFDSNELHVQYTEPIAFVQIPTRDSCFTLTDSTILMTKSDTLGGLWYIPRVLTVLDTASLTLLPNTVFTFQKGTELYVYGHLNAVDDADSCWITFQGEEGTPGNWWGISMYGDSTRMSNHNLYHCRLKDGINNIVIYNEESRLENCDISGASQYGVIYGRGSSHYHHNNQIHDNGITNLLMHSPDVRCTIYGDHVEYAGAADGIAVVDGAGPTIQSCTISNNAQHGISLWDAKYNYDSIRTHIYTCTIADNGAEGYGDGIHMYDSHALLRLSSLHANHDAGITISKESELNLWMTDGTDGSNQLDSNDVNFQSDQAYCEFGYWSTEQDAHGHHNCFSNPGSKQVWTNSAILIRRNYYDPDNENMFYAPDPQYLDRLPDSPECESLLGTIRIAGNEITPTPLDIFSKTAVPRSMRRVMHLIAKKQFDDAASMLSEIILDRDSLIGPPHFTLVRVLTKAMRNNSILAHVKTAVGQGRCVEAEYRLIAASCMRDAGKYTNALEMLGDMGAGLPSNLRRGIEIERSHATVLLKGAGSAGAEIARLKGIFPRDSIVATICRYLPFVGQRPDFSDTLLPKGAGPREAAPAGYALRNYPNPSNHRTLIEFAIPENTHVRLSIADALGREILLLADEEKPAGSHQAAFYGSRYPSGIYFCRLVAGEAILLRKIALVK